MAINEKIQLLHAELTQRQKAQQARALLQNLRSVVLETNSQIQEISDSGSLDTIDSEIKQALVDAWNVGKAAQTGFEDATIAELLDWSP